MLALALARTVAVAVRTLSYFKFFKHTQTFIHLHLSIALSSPYLSTLNAYLFEDLIDDTTRQRNGVSSKVASQLRGEAAVRQIP